MNRISVLIPDGESPFAYHVLTCLAQSKKVDIHILSKNSNVLSRFSRLRKSFHLLQENQNLLDTVIKICLQNKVDLCMPVDTAGLCFFSQHSEQLEKISKNILMQSSEKIQKVADKSAFANFLFEHNLSHPLTLTNRVSFEEKIKDLPFPVLVKPRLLGGGDGIVKYNNPEELIQLINNQDTFFDEYIIQEFIYGEDIDCSVLCKNGNILAYTIQKGINENLETYKPSEVIEFLKHPKLLSVASELVDILKWNGVAHIDMRVRASDGSIFIIEINPRFWGSIEGSLLAGVNFPYLTCLASLGDTFEVPEYKSGKYMSAFSAFKRIAQRRFSAHLLHETNFISYFKDPLPVLVRLMQKA